MSYSEQLLGSVGKAFVFDRLRPGLREYFLKTGIPDVPYNFIGSLFWISVLPVAFLFISRLWPFIIDKELNIFVEFLLALVLWTLAHSAVLLMLGLLFYFYLDMKIYSRTKKMETVLPDFLRMVSENLKGGMPFEKALWGSIKPEFGVLSHEIMLAAKKVMTGQDVDESLLSFTQKYDSPMMRRSFQLIIEGIKGGGRMVDIIDRVVDTLEETKELKAEMSATNLSYVIFVAVIVIFVAPGMFTLSYQFLTVLQDISGKVGASGDSAPTGLAVPIDFGEISIQPEVFKVFAINALLVISVFSAMIISIIQTGTIKGGLKYIPMMAIAAHIMFRVSMYIADTVFSGFFI